MTTTLPCSSAAGLDRSCGPDRPIALRQRAQSRVELACDADAAHRHLEHPDAAGSRPAPRAARSASSTRSYAVPVAAHRRSTETPCGVPKTRSNAPAYAGAPCSRVEKIAPPSSLATTIVRSGRGSSRTDHQPVGVVQERQVADVRQRPRRRRGRGRRRSAVDTVPSMPASPRLPMHQPALADRVRRRHHVEVADGLRRPDDEQRPGDHGRGHLGGDPQRQARRLVAASSSTAADSSRVGRPPRVDPARRRPPPVDDRHRVEVPGHPAGIGAHAAGARAPRSPRCRDARSAG